MPSGILHTSADAAVASSSDHTTATFITEYDSKSCSSRLRVPEWSAEGGHGNPKVMMACDPAWTRDGIGIGNSRAKDRKRAIFLFLSLVPWRIGDGGTMGSKGTNQSGYCITMKRRGGYQIKINFGY